MDELVNSAIEQALAATTPDASPEQREATLTAILHQRGVIEKGVWSDMKLLWFTWCQVWCNKPKPVMEQREFIDGLPCAGGRLVVSSDMAEAKKLVSQFYQE